MGFLSIFRKDTSKSDSREDVVSSDTAIVPQQPVSKKTDSQSILKGGLKMKHQIEIKLPKFLDPMFENLTPEEKKKFGRVALMCGTVALGVSVVYLTGYNRGMKKAINSRGIYIIKGGD